MEKTKTLLFKTSQKRIGKLETISLSNSELRSDHSIKFLGMIIDENPNWNEHVVTRFKKLKSISYSIKIISQYLDVKSLRIFYFSNFEGIMQFGVVFMAVAVQSTFSAFRRR